VAWKRLQIKELNGISLLIMVGILARLPQALFKSLQQELPIMVVRCCWLLEIIWLLVIICCVHIGYIVRKIPFNMLVTTSGDFEQDMLGGNRQWIPLKLNAWVMPIILHKAIMFYSSCLSRFI
jgi:preprotein translocase subunit SecY